ncbi:universal stress protein UspF [Enterobacter sp. C4G1]|uniref:universal stress protein UspF n=1 Tax=Enterobacter sp. C4G1 TaxID=3458724 RepID=UPI0040685995
MYNPTLVPIDISESGLTEMVIPHVQRHTVLNTTKVHFLTVVPFFPYYSSLGMGYAPEMSEISEMTQKALAKLNEIVKEFKLPAEKVVTHAVVGTPKDKILEYSEEIGAELIIIASHRPDLTTYLLGSNSSAIVRHSKCPVLVVR